MCLGIQGSQYITAYSLAVFYHEAVLGAVLKVSADELVSYQVCVDREDLCSICSIIAGFTTDVIDSLFIRGSIVGADNMSVGDWR